MFAIRRGMALAPVLMISMFLLTIGLALGMSAVFNLTHSQAQVSRQQAELAARAAVTQFIYQADRLGDEAEVVDPASPTAGLPPVQTYFAAHPVLFTAGDPPVEVRVQFDPAQPRFSTDNLRNPLAVAGYRRQVPPYSAHLVLQTRCGRTSRDFSVLLQRNWPYAVTAPNFMKLTSLAAPGSACSVNGSVLILDGPLNVTPNSPAIPLDGAAYDLTGPQASDSSRQGVEVDGPGSRLQGNVNSEISRLSVRPIHGGLWSGSERDRRATPELQRQLRQLLQVPAPPATAVNPTTAPSFRAATAGRPGFLVLGNATLTGGATDYFVVQGSLGNRLVSPLVAGGTTHQFPTDSSDGALRLQDCVLHVKGDMDLRGLGDGRYTLDGDNATLIVEGLLTLDHAFLNSGSRGMVILCKNLQLLQDSSGSFHGLILVQKHILALKAAGPGPATPGLLNIDGGLICGDDQSDYLLETPEYDFGLVGYRLLEKRVSGMELQGVNITYNPRAMRGLNELGNFKVVNFDCL